MRRKRCCTLAYMNMEAWEKTLSTGKATYWSRSRNELWVKGETSGNVQIVREILIDCDEDVVLLKVEQKGGAACHTGYRSCFYRRISGGKVERWAKKYLIRRKFTDEKTEAGHTEG